VKVEDGAQGDGDSIHHVHPFGWMSLVCHLLVVHPDYAPSKLVS